MHCKQCWSIRGLLLPLKAPNEGVVVSREALRLVWLACGLDRSCWAPSHVWKNLEQNLELVLYLSQPSWWPKICPSSRSNRSWGLILPELARVLEETGRAPIWCQRPLTAVGGPLPHVPCVGALSDLMGLSWLFFWAHFSSQCEYAALPLIPKPGGRMGRWPQ